MRVTLPRVIHAEWTKLRALRSTWIVLAPTALLVVGLAAAAGWAQHRDVSKGGAPPSTAEAVGAALLGIDLLSLVIGVFGVLLMTGEYSSGLIRATLAAVPRRLPVLWAKAVVLVPVAAPHSVQDHGVPYSPTAAAQAMYAIGTGNNPFKVLPPAGGAVVLAVWIAVVLAGGAAVLHRRDA